MWVKTVSKQTAFNSQIYFHVPIKTVAMVEIILKSKHIYISLCSILFHTKVRCVQLNCPLNKSH